MPSRITSESYKKAFPDILRSTVTYAKNASLLPKVIPQPKQVDDGNFGLLYHRPETEAEKSMHEMWLAKRRQEAFDWKAQQQIDLVMNRIAIRKSRSDTEALRRQEVNIVLEEAKASSRDAEYMRPSSPASSKGKARFAPTRLTSSRSRHTLSSRLSERDFADLTAASHDDEVLNGHTQIGGSVTVTVVGGGSQVISQSFTS